MQDFLYKELISTVGVGGIDLVQLTHFIDEDVKLTSIVQNNTMVSRSFDSPASAYTRSCVGFRAGCALSLPCTRAGREPPTCSSPPTHLPKSPSPEGEEKLDTSLVVQWFNICLAMQGTWVGFLIRN